MKQFVYRINGQEYVVAVNRKDKQAEVAVNGTNYQVELVNEEEEITLVARPASKPAAPSTPSNAPKSSAPTTGGGGAGKNAIKSPLPGVIVAINVSVGDTVQKGQTVAVLEAMKMENNIQASADGVVASVDVNVGDSILEGVTILSLN